MEFIIKEDRILTNFEYGELTISSIENEGFRPYQLFVSSIVGCSATIFRTVLEKMRITFESITLKAEISRNEMQANRIESLELLFIIHGTNIDPEKVQKALIMTRRNCGMIQSVKDAIVITENFEIITK